MLKIKFPLGRTVTTRCVIELLTECEISMLLARHSSGDWGDMCVDDIRSNNDALIHGERLFSSYKTPKGKVWIITEHDRSITTVLLPNEY